MSNELADVSTISTESTPVRASLEAAFAQHSSSSDVDSAVNSAVEHRDMLSRARDRQTNPAARYSTEGATRDRRRASIIDAVNEVRIKTAQGNVAPEPVKSGPHAGEVQIGAPQTWDSKAKAVWDQLPSEARIAIQRDHATLKAGHDAKFSAFEEHLAPVRAEYTKHGLNDAQAVGRLVEWQRALNNPQTQAQAFYNLAREVGFDLSQLGGGVPQQHQQPIPQHVATAASQAVSQFANGRPHFETVRETMGLIISRRPEKYLQRDGSVNLDTAYRDACKLEGLASNPAPRSAPTPPRPMPGASRGTPVRTHLLQAARR